MTKHSSKPTGAVPPGRPRTPGEPGRLAAGQTGQELLALRAQLARAEKAARRASTPAPATSTPARPTPARSTPVSPQREAELAGVLTDDHALHRAHARLRDAVYDSRYTLCPHAVGHARAEGFLEHDIMNVLLSGRVRAVYPEDRRWLVCGRFEACGVSLPLHVVVQHFRDGHIDVVTAFVPRHPHHVISRARLAVMLRYDDQQIRASTAAPAPRAGHRSRGRWKRSA